LSLTPAGFERLLALLDPDREGAGEAYVRIRKKLVKFFEWHACLCPEDLADRTIDRVGSKVEAGEPVRASQPLAYFHGVARNILREHWAEKRKDAAMRRGLLAELPAGGDAWEWPDKSDPDQRLRCLERCLKTLYPESRDLILRYYEGSSQARIANRKALAERLEIPQNALRIRSYRLRARLETCVENCLKKEKTGK